MSYLISRQTFDFKLEKLANPDLNDLFFGSYNFDTRKDLVALGRGGLAEGNGFTDGMGLELVVNQVLQDLRQVGLDQGVAGGDDELGQNVADLADGLDGGLKGRLADDDLVDLGDELDAEVAAETLGEGIVVLHGGGGLLGQGRAAGDQDEGQKQDGLHGDV